MAATSTGLRCPFAARFFFGEDFFLLGFSDFFADAAFAACFFCAVSYRRPVARRRHRRRWRRRRRGAEFGEQFSEHRHV